VIAHEQKSIIFALIFALFIATGLLIYSKKIKKRRNIKKMSSLKKPTSMTE